MLLEANVFAETIKGIPPSLATMIIGMTPIFELRGAIPVALGVYKMSVAGALFWSILGNMIPVLLIVFFIDDLSSWLSRRFGIVRRFFAWLFERTRKRAHDNIAKYGVWGLFIFVAIPLPMTGGWSGALAAFLFGIEKKKSIPAIFLGVLAAGIVVTLITIGAIKLPL